MLEGVFKGLFLWMYGLVLECVQYMANALLDVFTMDITFFETYVPVVTEMIKIFVAVGWALLLGNLAFQAMKGMTNGLGYEPEDPKILFCRTAVFSFLLFASPEICKTGMNLTSKIIALLRVPDSVVISTPDESAFGIGSSWLLTIIIGIILMFQLVKFFFEIGERYVITCILTFLSPLAFAMGGSKATKDIFTGWCRMYGSMCFIMVMNVFFIKLLLSAMSTVPSGLMVFPWVIFVIGIAKVGRKIDDIVCRIGLNAPHTGGGSRMMPGALTMLVARTAMASVNKAVAGSSKQSGNSMPDSKGTETGNDKTRAFTGFTQKQDSTSNSAKDTTNTACGEPQRNRPQQGNGNAGTGFNKNAVFSYGTEKHQSRNDESMLDIEYSEDAGNTSAANNSNSSNNSLNNSAAFKNPSQRPPQRPPLRANILAAGLSSNSKNNSSSENRQTATDKSKLNNSVTKENRLDNRTKDTKKPIAGLSPQQAQFNVNDTEKHRPQKDVNANQQNNPESKTPSDILSAGKSGLPLSKGFSINDTNAIRPQKNDDNNTIENRMSSTQTMPVKNNVSHHNAGNQEPIKSDNQYSATKAPAPLPITEIKTESKPTVQNQASKSVTEKGNYNSLKVEQETKHNKVSQNKPKEKTQDAQKPKQRR